ncbi:hypothetical protein AB1L88_02455 [Tautonia sp. JC769]|uniref:hypothetical protein n=1 Tax=Tautonia sp. JC769 TaxID=3232135 RepID=UPI00345B351D
MRRMPILLLAPSILLLAAVLPAQDAAPARPKSVDSPGTTPDPEQERLAFEFVREHHAELAELLVSLRGRDPREYAAAIRELGRARENLDRLRRRDPNRAPLVLETWKAGSRVQLLTARLVSDPGSRRDAELRRALTDQLAAQLALQKYDRAQLQARIDQLDQAIRRQEERADTVIDARLRAVQKKARRVRRQAEAETQAPPASSPPRTQGDSM